MDVFFSKVAEKEFLHLPAYAIRHIDQKIQKLRHNEQLTDVKKLQGADSMYRVRVGIYRIIYNLDTQHQRITILRIAHRKDVYRP